MDASSRILITNSFSSISILGGISLKDAFIFSSSSEFQGLVLLPLIHQCLNVSELLCRRLDGLRLELLNWIMIWSECILHL